MRHGIDPAERCGHIAVGAARDAPALRGWVTDTGVGMDATATAGTGLADLRQRLAVFCGPGVRLDLLVGEGGRGLRAEKTCTRWHRCCAGRTKPPTSSSRAGKNC